MFSSDPLFSADSCVFADSLSNRVYVDFCHSRGYARASEVLTANENIRESPQPMTKFCSECGERLTVSRATLWPRRALCYRCAPSYRRSHFLMAGAFILTLAAGFLGGWIARKPEPFYFIGTPVDSSVHVVSPFDTKSEPAKAKTVEIQQTEVPDGTLCGATTRSGKGCRRKVRGGGHCWQHR
jgi:hypothetical protein